MDTPRKFDNSTCFFSSADGTMRRPIANLICIQIVPSVDRLRIICMGTYNLPIVSLKLLKSNQNCSNTTPPTHFDHFTCCMYMPLLLLRFYQPGPHPLLHMHTTIMALNRTRLVRTGVPTSNRGYVANEGHAFPQIASKL